MLDGSCACGAVKYRLEREPMVVHCCHCTECQTQTGTAFVINAIIEAENINLLSGEVNPIEVKPESGRPHDIYRCAQCQTAMWSDYGRRPNYRFVRVGTMDNPSALPPDVHIFTRSKLDWVVIPQGAKSYDIFYPTMEEVWSEEALARREAALKEPPPSPS